MTSPTRSVRFRSYIRSSVLNTKQSYTSFCALRAERSRVESSRGLPQIENGEEKVPGQHTVLPPAQRPRIIATIIAKSMFRCCICPGTLPVFAPPALTSCHISLVHLPLHAPVRSPAAASSDYRLVHSALWSSGASSALSLSPRPPASFIHLVRDDLALSSGSGAASGWVDHFFPAAGRGRRGGRRRVERLGRSERRNTGGSAPVGAKLVSLELLKSWRFGGSLSTFLLRGGFEQGDKISGKMAMAVASCTGSLSSMCLSTRFRSTRNVMLKSVLSDGSLLVRSCPVTGSSSVSGLRSFRREGISVVGLSGPALDGGNVYVQIAEGLRSNGESRDRPVLVGASASSSASSVPGISYTEPVLDEGDGGNGFTGGRGGGGGGGGGGGDNSQGGSESSGAGHGGSSIGGGGIFSAFLSGWRSRVQADPQFPFKVLTEEVIGVGACVLGDMASRPNFGLDELDLVFSTIVVGSILNFTLMYMLAPTSVIGPVVSKLPGIFANCPTGHMFQVGPYSLLDRFGTFVYKGSQFAVVGFIAGVLGTVLSTSLLNARKKMDPDFVIQNEAPPTFLNAATWAIHMGLSSNIRYQSINGLEFAMAKSLPAGMFKTMVFLIRGLNNVLGGTSFVILARLTGSQPREGTPPPKEITEDDSSLEHAKTS